MTTRPGIRQVSIVLSAWVGMLIVPFAANAQAGDAGAMLNRADLNRDGAISRSEIVQLREQVFQRMDRNSDGYVDPEDRPSSFGGSRFDDAFQNLQGQFDTNGDRQISKSELIEAPSPAFDAGDLDDDGILSASEITSLRQGQPRR